jgi:HSP20 family protein
MVWPITDRYELTLDPFRELHRMQREMSRLFDGAGDGAADYPTVNLWSSVDEAVVTAELPGVEPTDLNLTVQGDLLVLEGERKADVPPEKATLLRSERTAGRFHRTVRLPFEVEADKVKAKVEHGLAQITLPRKESTKPRRIAIAAE